MGMLSLARCFAWVGPHPCDTLGCVGGVGCVGEIGWCAVLDGSVLH
jgi:hypothetical protein